MEARPAGRRWPSAGPRRRRRSGSTAARRASGRHMRRCNCRTAAAPSSSLLGGERQAFAGAERHLAGARQHGERIGVGVRAAGPRPRRPVADRHRAEERPAVDRDQALDNADDGGDDDGDGESTSKRKPTGSMRCEIRRHGGGDHRARVNGESDWRGTDTAPSPRPAARRGGAGPAGDRLQRRCLSASCPRSRSAARSSRPRG